MKARVSHLIGDPVLGSREEVGAAVIKLHAGTAAITDDSRRRCVSEEPVGQQRPYIVVAWLVAQRAKFTRNDQHVGTRMGDTEITRPVYRGGAGRAAELCDGDLACIRFESHGV